MTGALDGIRIVDLTTVVLGPYALQILGDLGADVIKVEAPEGDSMRHVGCQRSEAMGPVHLTINRNKRGVALDLRNEAARAALLELIRTADVFVHSMRPAAAARLGLDYDAVRALRPDVIYCRATGYGSDGPYAGRPAYDDMIQGLSAMTSLNAMLAGEPRFTPTIMADKTVGLTLAYALLAALFHRERSGEGQLVEVPMFETMASFMMVEHIWGRVYDRDAGALGYNRIMNPLRKPYRTQDGHLCVLAYSNKNWRDLVTAAGRPELAMDERFTTPEKRNRNGDALYTLMVEIIATRTSAEWLDLLLRLDVPVAPMNRPQDLFTDPHLQAVDFFFSATHPTEGEIVQMAPPVQMSATPLTVRRLAPTIGEHTEEVLREAGLDDAQIRAAMARKSA